MKNLSIRQIKCLITLILAVFLCGAPAVAQTQKIAVKLDMTKVPMKTVMNEIEKQTKYLFLYTDEIDTKRIVSIKADSKPLNEVLPLLFKDTDITYEITVPNIVLSKRVASARPSAISGVVKDSGGLGIIGATVLIKGTTVGTTTGIDGDFALTVPASVDNPELSVSFIGSGADDAVGRKTTRRGSDYTFRIDRKDDTDYDVSARVNGVTVKCTYDSKKNIYRISGSEVTGDITITITKGAPVEVNVYVTLDKQSMYLVTYSGSVEDGHVPMYDGQNMYWSEAYNAYAWLVISSADEKEVVRTARNSIIIGEGEAAASIDYSGNVDLSGRIDVDDVHLDHDVYNARYTLVSMVMHKFLNADVNRDRKVDVKDAVWIVNRILSGQQGA